MGSKREAQLVGEELARLAGATETLTPEVVLDAAKTPGSVLHKFFTWDDRDAARQYRLNEARQVLRSIVVVHIEGEHVQRSRDWLSLADDEGAMRYVRSSFVWRTPDLRERVLEQAKADAQSFVQRYEQYEHLAKAVAAGKTVVAILETEKRRA